MKQNKPKNLIVAISFLLFFLFILNPVYKAKNETIDFPRNKLTDDIRDLNEAPSFFISNESIYVVWTKWVNSDESVIQFSKSKNGKTWAEAVTISENTTKAIEPSIAVNNQFVHVVWKDFRHGNPELFYRRSNDYGDTWDKEERLTFNSSRITTLYDISLKVDNDILYVLWKDYRSGSAEVFIKRSINNGISWGEDERLTWDYKPSYSPSFYVDDQNIFIAYEEWGGFRGSICYLFSNDYGYSFEDKIYLTDNNSFGDSKHPHIFSANDQVYLVWQDDRSGSFDIYFRKSENLGDTWDELVRITNNDNDSVNPKVFSFKEKIIIIWLEKRNEEFSILYTQSWDGGKSWDKIKTLVEDQDCYDLDIFGINHDVHLIWQQYHEASYSDIWYMKSFFSMNSPTDDTSENDKQKSPGFELIIFLMIFIFLIILKKIKDKRGEKFE